MPNGYTQVSASALKDATGTLVANATISFAPVSNSGKSISFRAGGGGQTISQPVKATVTNGAFTIQLADTTLTTPINVGYAVTVIDNLTGDSLLGPGYGCFQPSGATYSFDNYDPNLPGQVTVQTGPPGTGFAFKGAYSASTTYGLGDTVLVSGQSYGSLVAGNVGNSPATSPASWVLVAAAGEVSTADLNIATSDAQLNVLHQLGVNRSQNLFDYTATVPGALQADGSIAANAAYVTTDFMFMTGSGDVISNVPSGFGDSSHPNYSIFYAEDKLTIISAVLTNTPAGTPLALPSGAYWYRTSIGIGAIAAGNTTMFVPGTVVPSQYVPYTVTLPETTNLVREGTAINNTANATVDALANSLGLSPVRNLFNLAGSQSGNYWNASNGLTASSGNVASNDMVVAGLADVISNVALVAGGASATLWLDSNKNVISQFTTGLAPSTALAVPPNAVYLRATFALGGAGNAMLVGGTVVPSQYVPYVVPIPSSTAITSQINSSDGAALETILSKLAQPTALSNMYDCNSSDVILNAYIQLADGTIRTNVSGQFVTGYIYVAGAGNVITNNGIPANTCYLFCDVNKNVISVVGPLSAGIAPNTPIAVPPNAVYMRLSLAAVLGSTPQVTQTTTMVMWGTTPPPPVGSYSLFVPYSAVASLKPFQGKRMYVRGDSITFNSNGAWPAGVAAYHNMAYTDQAVNPTNNLGPYNAATTYAVDDMVYENGIYYVSLQAANTGNDPATSPAFWTIESLRRDRIGESGFSMTEFLADFGANTVAFPDGPTMVQQLATALSNKDVFFIFMGTNDYSAPLGAFGDPPVNQGRAIYGGTGVYNSFYSTLEFAVQTSLQAIALTGRQIRLILITPYHNSRGTLSAFLAQIQAFHDVGREWGVPIIDNAATLNVNSFNWPQTVLLEADGVTRLHVNALGYQYLINNIARQMALYAQW